MSRIERLRATLEEPLLVTTPANVFYLTGLMSSNAALFVEPDRQRLFTDSRYFERARAIDGVEAVETQRALVRALGELLDGRIGFEPHGVTFAEYSALADAGLELVPRAGAVEAFRAVKEPGELGLITHAAAVDGVRAGLTGIEADRIARERIDAAGFGDNFRHGLGHGLGVMVHEAPRLSAESDDTLVAGNVVTIEPGIYIPGLGGVRIEDL